jgi:LuxR family transcriptional regulator, maltose regulon positive regulatory protein
MSTRQAPGGAARASTPEPGDPAPVDFGQQAVCAAARPGIVDRPALVDSLMSARHVPVVLVSAPAGYGKTTLLSLWRERDGRPFAWVSLDAAHNDSVALVADIVTVLAPILGEGGESVDELRAPAAPLEEFVLPALIDACAACASRAGGNA